MDPFEAIGIIVLLGPLVVTAGGMFYAATKDALKGSRPMASLSLSKPSKKEEDADEERSQRDSQVWSYIKELRRRIR